MKKLKKLVSLSLVLALCLSLSAAAFAEDISGAQLHPGDWGDGPSLTLKGVTAQREVDLELPVCYDVAVGGSMVLKLDFPAGHNRTYGFRIAGVYVSPNWDDCLIDESGMSLARWDIPAEKMAYDIAEKDGKTEYVYEFTDYEMGQFNGYSKAIYMDVYWMDDIDNDGQSDGDGSAYFYIHVVPAASAAPATPGFADVPADAYYAEPVAWAVEKGITNGTSSTTFSPETTCNTAQILTFLWRASGEPEAAASGLADVAEGAYYYGAAQWAKSMGMISGDTLSPETPCTRASTVMYMWQAAGSPSVETKTAFTDVPADADYAMAVAWAVENGVTTGTSSTAFSPDQTCTRGQIATFLYRAFA